MTPQAWCPLAGVAYPAWGNTFTAAAEQRIRAELDRQCGKYDVEDWVIALSWLLKHPAGISPIIGSTTPERIRAATQALDLKYERVDWYRLLEARNGAPVP
jgi:predicted oxidoreductase